jgi:hypothetical protein
MSEIVAFFNSTAIPIKFKFIAMVMIFVLFVLTIFRKNIPPAIKILYEDFIKPKQTTNMVPSSVIVCKTVACQIVILQFRNAHP